MKAIADHGAQFVGCNVAFLEGGTRDHFMRWLSIEFPHLVDGYERLYAKKYPAAAYRKEVMDLVSAMRTKYGMERREEKELRDYDRDRHRAGSSARTEPAASGEPTLFAFETPT